MFKPKSRTYIKGTFVPTPLRVIAIIHLCIAFSALLFDMGYPFMGQLFENKRLNAIYETVLQNESHFQQLPYQKQVEIEGSHQSLVSRMHTPFLSKLRKSFSIILLELPPFQKAWIFFSILIPILILLKIEGAQRAAWILPFITIVYGVNQLFLYPSHAHLYEDSLFPTEQVIVNDYLNDPLSTNILEQREQLLKGWHSYVVNQWANEPPSSNEEEFKKQLSKGLFAFNVARIDVIQQDSALPSYLRRKGSLFILSFLLWNIFFAIFVNRRKWFIEIA